MLLKTTTQLLDISENKIVMHITFLIKIKHFLLFLILQYLNNVKCLNIIITFFLFFVKNFTKEKKIYFLKTIFIIKS